MSLNTENKFFKTSLKVKNNFIEKYSDYIVSDFESQINKEKIDISNNNVIVRECTYDEYLEESKIKES